MLYWRYMTLDEYNDLSNSEKKFSNLFFIKDADTVYQGTELFTDQIVIYDGKVPYSNIGDRLYINANTLEGYIWAGKWVKHVNHAVSFTNNYINNSEVSTVVCDFEKDGLVVKFIDGSIDIVKFEDFLIDLEYSTGNKKFNIINESCILLNSRKAIRIRDFVTGITFEGTTIKIEFRDGSVGLSLDIGNMIKSGNNVIYITGNRFIQECLKNSGADASIITNGLYVIHNKTLIQSVTEDIKSTTIVKSVIAYMTSKFGQYMFNKMNKVREGLEDEIIVADNRGDAKASGTKIINAATAHGDSSNILTEKATVDYIQTHIITKENKIISKSDNIPKTAEEASDEKIISEKSVLTVAGVHLI